MLRGTALTRNKLPYLLSIPISPFEWSFTDRWWEKNSLSHSTKHGCESLHWISILAESFLSEYIEVSTVGALNNWYQWVNQGCSCTNKVVRHTDHVPCSLTMIRWGKSVKDGSLQCLQSSMMGSLGARGVLVYLYLPIYYRRSISKGH